MGGCPTWLEQRQSRPRRGLVRSDVWRPSVAAVGSPLGARGGHEAQVFALPRLGRGLNSTTGDDAAACTSSLLAPTKPSPRRGCTCLDRWAGRGCPTRTEDLTPKMALHPSIGAVRCAGLGPEVLACAYPHAQHLLLDSVNPSARLLSRPLQRPRRM